MIAKKKLNALLSKTIMENKRFKNLKRSKVSEKLEYKEVDLRKIYLYFRTKKII